MSVTYSFRPSKDALLNPKMDPTFKSLFTQNTKESKNALESFLSAILGAPVINVKIEKNEIPIESKRDKQSLFDITCTLKNEQQILNIEMQGINFLESFDSRSEYHIAHLLNHYVHKGVNWDEVPQAFMISVLNFIYDENSVDSLLWYTMKRQDSSELKSKRMNIIYLELPKLLESEDKPAEMLTPIQRWGKFFLYADKIEKSDYLKQLGEEEPGIMQAIQVLSEISQSDEEWRRERDYIDAINTEITIRAEAERRGFTSGMERGLKQGIEQGIKQGIEQGIERGLQQGAESTKIENAIAFLKLNKLSQEEIATCTGLSLEKIKNLAKQI